MRIIDTHAHIDQVEFDEDRDELFTQFKRSGIEKVIIPAIAPDMWEKQLAIASQYNCPFALGIHPWFSRDQLENDLYLLTQLIETQKGNPNFIAIGECGLDKSKADNWQQQLAYFDIQIELANKLELPVILHVVKAHNEVLNVLKKTNLTRGGVIHAYSGSVETGLEYIKLGFKLGIGALVVNKNAKKLRRAVAELPVEALVIETDSPYMLPKSTTETRHTPLFTAQYIAEVACLRKKTSVFISERLFENSTQLFEL